MMSDVCKHCVNAPCLEVCPTGAIVRTEFDTVYIQEPACNGCRDCISACPFGVIHVSAEKHIAQKCTFCYDRLQNGLVPACAQACPTAVDPVRADRRAAASGRRGGSSSSTARGRREAYLYGADDKVLGGLNAFYLLMDPPETYGLPAEVGAQGARAGRSGRRRSRRSRPRWRWPLGAFVAFGRPEGAWPRPRRRRPGGADDGPDMNPFVADPDWDGLIIWYFFLGGIAAGSYAWPRWPTCSATRTTAGRPGGRTTSPSRWSASAACC